MIERKAHLRRQGEEGVHGQEVWGRGREEFVWHTSGQGPGGACSVSSLPAALVHFGEVRVGLQEVEAVIHQEAVGKEGRAGGRRLVQWGQEVGEQGGLKSHQSPVRPWSTPSTQEQRGGSEQPQFKTGDAALQGQRGAPKHLNFKSGALGTSY